MEFVFCCILCCDCSHESIPFGVAHLRSLIAAMDNAAIENSCGIVASQGVGIELRKTALANLERLVTLAIGQFGPEALLWTLLASIVSALPLEEEITLSLIGAHPQETGVLALAELLTRLEIMIDRVTSPDPPDSATGIGSAACPELPTCNGTIAHGQRPLVQHELESQDDH